MEMSWTRTVTFLAKPSVTKKRMLQRRSQRKLKISPPWKE